MSSISSARFDKRFYDSMEIMDAEKFHKWIEACLKYHRITVKMIETIFQHRLGQPLKVLEIGAGSCSLSLLVSNLDFVAEIYCLDISRLRMEMWSLKANELIQGLLDKLTFIEGDFNVSLPFENSFFDLILFDAALHHSRSIWETLYQCNRVLTTNGTILAQREGYLSPLRYRKQLAQLLLTEEAKKGVSENRYLKEQYEYFFNVNGFDVVFHSIARHFSNTKLIWFLNGILFNRWLIIATKNKSLEQF